MRISDIPMGGVFSEITIGMSVVQYKKIGTVMLSLSAVRRCGTSYLTFIKLCAFVLAVCMK